MIPLRTVLLDNEAVQALLDRHHRKHRRTLQLLDTVTARGATAGEPVSVIVPTTVRVEAGWVRRSPRAADANRLGVRDVVLDAAAADRAADIRARLQVSVTDAHIGAAIAASPRSCAVLTSDVDDVRRIAAHLDVAVTVVAL